MTAAIHPEFMRLFDELEQGHIALRDKLNAWIDDGQELEEKLVPEVIKYEAWRCHIMEYLGDILLSLDIDSQLYHRESLTQTTYYRIIQEAPFYWQIMHKPEGYAGDAEMMNFIYRNQFIGDSPFGKLLHKHAVESKACQAVRNRREFLYERIRKVMKNNHGNILSLAAGPALEMHEALRNYRSNGLTCHALDHDIKTLRRHSNNDRRLTYALANAFSIIKGDYRIAIPRRATKAYCNPRRDLKGLRRLALPLLYAFSELKMESYDLVYTAGLYDYIKTFPDHPEKGTIALTKNLFEFVKPGGSLIIGNFSKNIPRDHRFPIEYIYNWQLIYRDEKEMFEFARAISERHIALMTIEQEPLGINYFLKIDKTA